MIIPEYWAEARRQHRGAKKQVTVRRFGWSNESQLAAQTHAEARVEEALKQAIQDSRVPRRESKVPYNGAEGLPIREEVIQRTERCVITRNSYGALCLNTPDTLFADIDVASKSYLGHTLIVCLMLGIVATLVTGSILAGAIAGFILLPLLVWLQLVVTRRLQSGDPANAELSKIRKRAEQFPEWTLRVYRTPAGFRILVTHRVFDPSEADVSRFFQCFGVDPMYVRMCRNQHCFRARLTAKPWRIGIASHMRPRPGVWPVHPGSLAHRLAWIEQYQAIAKDYAACEYVTTLGRDQVHDLVQPVLEIHDQLCQAHSGRPIA